MIININKIIILVVVNPLKSHIIQFQNHRIFQKFVKKNYEIGSEMKNNKKIILSQAF